MKFVSEDGRIGNVARIELGDDTTTWLEILPTRKITHPKYGALDITKPQLEEMLANFNAKVRGVDIAIDYAHMKDPSKGEQAAGWIKEAEIRASTDGQGESLWGRVEFNADAAKEIKDGKWRYVSANIWTEWDDGQGQKHKNVLAGAALTNRPFMKGMAPVNFSEMEEFAEQEARNLLERGTEEGWLALSEDFRVFLTELGKGEDGKWSKHSHQNFEEVNMDKELLKRLGLAEDADQAAVDAKVKELAEFRDEHEKQEEKDERTFAEQFPEQARELEEIRAKDKRMEAGIAVRRLNEKGMPTKVNPKVTALLLGETSYKFDENGTEKEEAITLSSVLEDVIKAGIVLVGKKRPDDDNEHDEAGFDDPRDELAADAEKLMSENKDMEYEEAREQAAQAKPELAKRAARMFAEQRR